jgi:hypothetical protein
MVDKFFALIWPYVIGGQKSIFGLLFEASVRVVGFLSWLLGAKTATIFCIAVSVFVGLATMASGLYYFGPNSHLIPSGIECLACILTLLAGILSIPLSSTLFLNSLEIAEDRAKLRKLNTAN